MAYFKTTWSVACGLVGGLCGLVGCGARNELPVGGDSASVCAGGSTTCAALDLTDVVTYSAGKRPDTVVMADLDGDGLLDLAVAPDGEYSVTVLRNQGAGVFAPGVAHETSSSAGSNGLAAGDLNHDGKVDLVTGAAVMNSDGAYVSVLLNQGGGSFAKGVLYTAGISPGSIALGDMDGDGALDIVTGNIWEGVAVLRNLGDGTFAAKVNVGMDSGPSAVALGDVNGDGLLDIASASDGTSGVAIFLNQGQGTFGEPSLYSGSALSSVALGDVNGDGWLDMVYSSTSKTIVGVRLNAGDGKFGKAVTYAVPVNPESVALADLNGDGFLDLAVSSATGVVSVLLNRCNGTFGTETRYSAGLRPLSVAVGDLDGDGRPDVATANFQADTVGVLFNLGCTP